MTDRLVTDWDPEQDLAALLDGLTEELLAAANHEIAPYLDEAAEERGEGADAIRRLIGAADASLAALPVSGFVAPGLRAYVSRNQ
jgi:hypothetical protein